MISHYLAQFSVLRHMSLSSILVTRFKSSNRKKIYKQLLSVFLKNGDEQEREKEKFTGMAVAKLFAVHTNKISYIFVVATNT